MNRPTPRSTDDYVFRHYRPWFRLRVILALMTIGAVTLLGLWLQNVLPLASLPLVGGYALRQIFWYCTEHVSIVGYNLSIHRGMLHTEQISFPVWRVYLRTPQTLLGRVCGYGTVLVLVGEQRYVIHQIESIRLLSDVINARQSELVVQVPGIHYLP